MSQNVVRKFLPLPRIAQRAIRHTFCLVDLKGSCRLMGLPIDRFKLECEESHSFVSGLTAGLLETAIEAGITPTRPPGTFPP